MKLKASWKRTPQEDIYEEVGTYVAIKWGDSHREEIVKWAKDQGIPNVLNSDEIHTTLIYSRVGFKHSCSSTDFDTDISDGEFHVFTNEKLGHKALVMKFKSKTLSNRHNEIMKNNPKAVYDFPEYIPHITLSYDVEDFDVSKLDYKSLSDYLGGTIENGVEYTEDLNIEKFSNK